MRGVKCVGRKFPPEPKIVPTAPIVFALEPLQCDFLERKGVVGSFGAVGGAYR